MNKPINNTWNKFTRWLKDELCLVGKVLMEHPKWEGVPVEDDTYDSDDSGDDDNIEVAPTMQDYRF